MQIPMWMLPKIQFWPYCYIIIKEIKQDFDEDLAELGLSKKENQKNAPVVNVTEPNPEPEPVSNLTTKEICVKNCTHTCTHELNLTVSGVIDCLNNCNCDDNTEQLIKSMILLIT